MGSSYATVQDITDLWRKMTSTETERAEKLIPLVSARLRTEAKKVGKNLDEMIASDPDLSEVAKSVTIDVVTRMLLTSTTDEPMTQVSQSALGYSISGTYLVPGGGLYIKKSELAQLGLRRQQMGVIDLYDATRNKCDPVG